MIGGAEDDPGGELLEQVARREAFDGGLGADRHEDRRFDRAMRGVEQAGAGVGVRAGGLDLEAERGRQPLLWRMG